MTKYTPRIDLIDAIRNPSPDNQDTVATPHWIIDAVMGGQMVQDESTGVVTVLCATGLMVDAKVGDWIVHYASGGFGVLTPEAFAETYVEVEVKKKTTNDES